MMPNILNLLSKYASGKNVIILLIITFSVYGFMLMVTIPNIMNYANNMELLDMQPTGYDANYAKTLFDSLGEEGRDAYLFRQIPVDMIYPFLFALTYSLLLIYLFQKGFNLSSKIKYFALVPILGGLFDYLENFSIIFMLFIYPEFSDALANTSNIFSILKSLFTTLFFILLLIALVSILIRRLRVR